MIIFNGKIFGVFGYPVLGTEFGATTSSQQGCSLSAFIIDGFVSVWKTTACPEGRTFLGFPVLALMT
jgi:hypothetical protein